MGLPPYVKPPKAFDGKYRYIPKAKITKEDRQFLVDQQAKLLGYLEEVNYVGTLPRPLRELIVQSKRWITAGIRQADGRQIATRHFRNDLPSEGLLIEKSSQLAKGIDKLIADCTALKPKNQQTGQGIK